MKFHPVFLGLLLALCPLAEARKPNFIVIFIDDLGYGDIGPFGSKKNETPHLDRMAKEGMKLTSFYLASSVCTPSRAALMTGSYPRRVGLGQGSDHAVLFPGDVHGLHPREITIAEMLKEAAMRRVASESGTWAISLSFYLRPRASTNTLEFRIPMTCGRD